MGISQKIPHLIARFHKSAVFCGDHIILNQIIPLSGNTWQIHKNIFSVLRPGRLPLPAFARLIPQNLFLAVALKFLQSFTKKRIILPGYETTFNAYPGRGRQIDRTRELIREIFRQNKTPSVIPAGIGPVQNAQFAQRRSAIAFIRRPDA